MCMEGKEKLKLQGHVDPLSASAPQDRERRWGLRHNWELKAWLPLTFSEIQEPSCPFP